MNRTLRVGLFVGVVGCAVAASALMVRAGRAAGVGLSLACVLVACLLALTLGGGAWWW